MSGRPETGQLDPDLAIGFSAFHDVSESPNAVIAAETPAAGLEPGGILSFIFTSGAAASCKSA
jgi:hypothetical protein